PPAGGLTRTTPKVRPASAPLSKPTRRPPWPPEPMAATDNELVLRARGDISDVQTKLKQAGVAVVAFGDKAKGAGDAVTRLGGALGGANRLMIDFGRAANDAQQFAFGWRSGLIAVSNQLEGLIYGLRAAREQAAVTGRSVTRSLVASLASPSGL